MGLDPDVFWRLTLRDFFIKMWAFNQDREWKERLVRRQTYILAYPNAKGKLNENDLWKLPSEIRKGEHVVDSKKAEKIFLNSI